MFLGGGRLVARAVAACSRRSCSSMQAGLALPAWACARWQHVRPAAGATAAAPLHSSSSSSSSGNEPSMSSSTTSSTGVSSIYSQPQLYDDAFSYRQFEDEARFLVDAFTRYCPGQPLNSVLELGCGPANHAVLLAGMGAGASGGVWGLDMSAEMLAHAGAKAAAAGVQLQLVQGDMRDFTIPELEGRTDLVVCLLGTFSHLLDNASALAAFRRIAEHLRPGGLFVLELAHPGDLFDGSLLLGNGGDELWEVEHGGRRLMVNWGTEMDVFDPATQVLQRTVSISAMKGDDVAEALVEEVVSYRQFTVQEVDLLAMASGLKILGLYGEMDLKVDLQHEEAYRLVVVLQKPGA